MSQNKLYCAKDGCQEDMTKASFNDMIMHDINVHGDDFLKSCLTTATLETKATIDFPANTQMDEHRPSVYAREFDDKNPNWHNHPEYNLLFLRAQQNYANDLLRSRGHIFLNEIYDMLGFDRTSAGAVVGWVIDGSGYVDFGTFDAQTTPTETITLDFNVDGVMYDKIEKIHV